MGGQGGHGTWPDGADTAEAEAVAVALPAGEPPEPDTDGDPWLPEDIVRNGTDPADRRVWVYLPDHDEDGWPWLEASTARPAQWTHRNDLPADLQLLVRGGRWAIPGPDDPVWMAWSAGVGHGALDRIASAGSATADELRALAAETVAYLRAHMAGGGS